ncbi:SSI family serine proteinase inhibitor [Micromonospora krabiensis]|uniref:Subtilisin inhibitor-like n=1 Tax=Micromonospora krabiensis TaxID=307121 RepID=A0A1C3N046_9ACTN|nr:SSI family serine proteinase inhibitor [Micromonospora krabiensis]SBV25963.1 Subtilisin inhibitor-like [Micromonospora krabiensis]
MPFAQRIVALVAAVLVAGGLTAAARPEAAHAAARPEATHAVPRADQPPSVLVLTVQPPTAAPRASVLFCGPSGGDHPAASAACGTLAGVGGDPGTLNLDPDTLCTLEYAPVTVRALGFWGDRPVTYAKTFANRCVLLRETGELFAF